jgi:glycyl-tRNA synthetase beta chain
VVLGSFEREFLSLPEEVLVTVMRDHQKYFAVEDADGKLAPHFLAVLNTQVDEDGAATIRHGNARVLTARFNDARFFWDTDQKIPLTDRVELLKSVTFQKDLGSYWEKTQANMRLAKALAEFCAARGTTMDAAAIESAAQLAKADLTAELVKEFTELQGVVGGLYAVAQGHSATVAGAIYDQYSATPRSMEAAIVGLADRANTIADMFALGLAPTGSKDPFALRRAANAIVRILADQPLPLTISRVIDLALQHSASGKVQSAVPAIEQFFLERLTFFLRESAGLDYDVVNAVLAAGNDDVQDAILRGKALASVRSTDDFVAIAAAFKRIRNILSQAQEKQIVFADAVDSALMKQPEEQSLFAALQELSPRVEQLRLERNYSAALDAIATLRPAVDAFFDKVMVMDPDAAVRANRLALLTALLENFSNIADFSLIAPAASS